MNPRTKTIKENLKTPTSIISCASECHKFRSKFHDDYCLVLWSNIYGMSSMEYDHNS